MSLYVVQHSVSLCFVNNIYNRAVETITPEMLQRVWQQFDYRIDVCRGNERCAHRGTLMDVHKIWTVRLPIDTCCDCTR
jgi:hypothetical protein